MHKTALSCTPKYDFWANVYKKNCWQEICPHFPFTNKGICWCALGKLSGAHMLALIYLHYASADFFCTTRPTPALISVRSFTRNRLLSVRRGFHCHASIDSKEWAMPQSSIKTSKYIIGAIRVKLCEKNSKRCRQISSVSVTDNMKTITWVSLWSLNALEMAGLLPINGINSLFQSSVLTTAKSKPDR